MASKALDRARNKMSDAGVDPTAIEVFAHYFRLLELGETGKIPESTIERNTRSVRKDVSVAGLTIAGTPARSAGASFSIIPQTGKLNALMKTATPSIGTQM
jgi:UTP--glucose-1-phosphate uridylyltransferase